MYNPNGSMEEPKDIIIIANGLLKVNLKAKVVDN